MKYYPTPLIITPHVSYRNNTITGNTTCIIVLVVIVLLV